MDAHRSCPECNKPVKGRIDKKFCSDECRTSYHNNSKRSFRHMASSIDKILRRNRMILADMNPGEKITVQKEFLRLQRFDFNYHTNIYITKKGKTYYFCYDYGYTELDKGRIMIVKRSGYV